MSILDYIPRVVYNKYRTEVKYLLRKRLLHSGWQVSYCYLPAHEDNWILLGNYSTREDCLCIIEHSHH